jgi:tripartite-type tricarboxylate transporter receptor subunit TctC
MNTFFRAALSLLSATALVGGAWAQAWPTKPVRVVVAFTAGGTTDILARSVSQQLSDKLKQPFVVDNKPGAGGNVGTESVVRAAPDGYTLIVNSVGPIAVNPTLYPKLAYNPLTELVPIVQIADVPNVLVVHPALPVKTFEDFVAYARANPGKLNYSSTGIGTSSHLSGFVLGKRAGIDATHVPYKGADALRDLLAGRVQFMFATIPSVIQHIHSGGLRAIAVTSVKLALASRGADGGREWPSRFRGRFVVRLLRPQGHAERSGGHAEPGRQRDHCRTGNGSAAHQGGR